MGALAPSLPYTNQTTECETNYGRDMMKRKSPDRCPCCKRIVPGMVFEPWEQCSACDEADDASNSAAAEAFEREQDMKFLRELRQRAERASQYSTTLEERARLVLDAWEAI